MASAAMYAVVLNFKHIYLYSAPAFGILYLRQLVLLDTVPFPQKLKNFAQLAAQTIAITLISFGPFLMQSNPVGQLKQIFARLFPFGRGIIHDYPASNFWILFVDYMRFYGGHQNTPEGFLFKASKSEYDEDAHKEGFKQASLALTGLFLIVSATHANLRSPLSFRCSGASTQATSVSTWLW